MSRSATPPGRRGWRSSSRSAMGRGTSSSTTGSTWSGGRAFARGRTSPPWNGSTSAGCRLPLRSRITAGRVPPWPGSRRRPARRLRGRDVYLSFSASGDTVLTDIEIAQGAKMRPIVEVATDIGLSREDLVLKGDHIAKVRLEAVERARKAKQGSLVLVTGITPTRHGEGKTLTTVGLGQALNRVGTKAIVAIREPSLGPVFGTKGGAAGGGYSQVLPMEDINLHFTGDIHAVTAANNLITAILDAHVFHGNELSIDPTRVMFPRCEDMNDRELRNIVVGLGGPKQGVPREDNFIITAASEAMAILCLTDGIWIRSGGGKVRRHCLQSRRPGPERGGPGRVRPRLEAPWRGEAEGPRGGGPDGPRGRLHEPRGPPCYPPKTRAPPHRGGEPVRDGHGPRDRGGPRSLRRTRHSGGGPHVPRPGRGGGPLARPCGPRDRQGGPRKRATGLRGRRRVRGEGREGRHGDLWGGRGEVRRGSAGRPREAPERGPRPPSDLHREDPTLPLRRRDPPRRSERLGPGGPRRAPERRRGVPRRPGGGHHADARPRAGACGSPDGHRGDGENQGTVLTATSASSTALRPATATAR